MVKQVAFGFVLGFGLLRGLVACAATTQLATDACRLDALRILPDDIEQVTAYDAIDLVTRLKACKAGDAGR